MGHRVDDGLDHDFGRDLVDARRPGAVRSRSDDSVDLAENEVHGLIHQPEGRAQIGLVRRNGFLHFRSVEVGAPDLGTQHEPLGGLAEQQDRGVRRDAVVQQVQMGQNLLGLRSGQSKSADPASHIHEPQHLLEVQVLHRRLLAGRRVERRQPQQPLDLQVLDESRVETGAKFLDRLVLPADQARFGSADERPHLRVPIRVRHPLQEDQTVRADGRGVVELSLGRRHAIPILGSVLCSEQPQIEVAPLHFVQVEVVRPPVRRRRLLEQEDLEELPQQRVVPQVVGDRAPVPRELPLDAADEDPQSGHCAKLRPSGSWRLSRSPVAALLSSCHRGVRVRVRSAFHSVLLA